MSVFVDTVIFIDALDARSEKAREGLSAILQEGPVLTSVVTLMEYGTGCYRHGLPDRVGTFLRFLDDTRIQMVPVDQAVSLCAAQIRGTYPSFRAMDALQLAAAEEARADRFLTNDRQLLQYQSRNMKVQLL